MTPLLMFNLVQINSHFKSKTIDYLNLKVGFFLSPSNLATCYNFAMTKNHESAGQQLLKTWQKLENKPMGRWVFKRIIAANIPYTGSIKADVQKLQPGFCEVALKYRKSNTNHLNSIHALALSNLGEMTSGLAMMSGLSSDIRGIPVNINTDYHRKARGHLKAISEVEIPLVKEPKTIHYATAKIFNSDQTLVSTVTVKWLLSPKI
jgi:acyl-coenzyme A thioesterase PaaI-like protein